MTGIRERIAESLREHRSSSSYSGGVHCSCDNWKWTNGHGWHDHLADVLLSLPDIVIVERGELAKAIAGGIRGYADSESQAYSYHGDGSALEAMHDLERDAPNIAQYIFTHSSLAAAG